MLYSTLYAPSLLLLLGSAFANPVPESQATPTGVVILIGEPELHEPPTRREVESIEKREAAQGLTYLLTADQTNALILHNKARLDRKVPSIGWDFTLQAAAQKYANEMATTGKFAHSASSTRPNQGENLAFASSSDPIKNPISLGVQAWIDEKVFYNNELIPNGNFSKYGHYTQVVWSSSTRVGIATASDKKGGWYTVARYSPPGNFAGQRPS